MPGAAGVACMIVRGGTSKGAVFRRRDLPADPAERDDLILRVMGSPDPRQIDGIGGAHPLTCKVAVVGRSAATGCDVDYLFLQPSVDRRMVSTAQNCGNMLAAVGPFAVERGLVPTTPGDETASVRIRMVNTGAVAVASFGLAPHGMPEYDGVTAISGVPGTAAPVHLYFEDIAGSSCGALLPTGAAVDTVAGVECTLIDNGMPVAVLRAADVDVTCREDPATLEGRAPLRRQLEAIRLDAGRQMGLGDVREMTVPKLTMVAPATGTAAGIATRTFIPHRCHEAIGVLGAVSVATAALLPGTAASDLLCGAGSQNALSARSGHLDRLVTLQHPTGVLVTSIALSWRARQGRLERVEMHRAGIVRTARKLADAIVFPRPRR